MIVSLTGFFSAMARNSSLSMLHSQGGQSDKRAHRCHVEMIAAGTALRALAHPTLRPRMSMHGGEEACDAEARQPGPHRLLADAEIPRADHGIGAADQVLDRQQSDAAFADGY